MNVEFLKLLKSSKKGTKAERRKRGEEPIWVIIHLYMGMS
jgi:hypothetical protein